MRKTFAALVSGISLATLASLPALASEFQDGAKLYAEGKYAQALPLLQKAAQFNPMSWQTHYYLANTNLALGRMTTAKYEYDLCLKTCNKPDIIARCKEGIARADKHTGQVRSSSSSSTASATSASSHSSTKSEDDDDDENGGGKPSSSSGMTDAQRVIATRKEEIMRQAKNECSRIKKAATEQIQEEKASANEFYQDHDGKVFTDISDEREAEIQRDADAKCQRIMEDAQRKIRSMGN